MADGLRAQEIRGMAKYATDDPSENWGAEFWNRFERWSKELLAYEIQELVDNADGAPFGA